MKIKSFFLKHIQIISLLSVSLSINATTVTFDEPIIAIENGFTTQGFNFEFSSNHYYLESNDFRYGTNSDTTSLVLDDLQGSNSVRITSASGGAFDLIGFDVMSASEHYGSTQVRTSTTTQNNMVVYVDEYTDYFPDNSFEYNGLWWYGFDFIYVSGFGNDDYDDWFRIDNIELEAIPVSETGTLFLLGVGLLIIWTLGKYNYKYDNY